MALPALAETRLSLVICPKCGVEFALPSTWDASLRESHATFYCPAGHPMSYAGETEKEQLRKTAESLRRRLELEQSAARAAERETERQRRRVSAAKGRLTRVRNRVAAGKCPRCGKRFAELAEHMAERHPDYAEGGTDGR